MTLPTYHEARQTALETAERGDAHEAFGTFRWTLEYPGQFGDDPERWRDALTVFARIATALAGDEFAALAHRAARAPDDTQALYDLGYGLIEQGLNGMAATVLARANLLCPSQEPIVTELACALERDLRFHEACRILIEQSFLCRYLLAYNGLMTGDLIEPRQLLRSLGPGDDANLAAMVARIKGMLTRADASVTGRSVALRANSPFWRIGVGGPGGAGSGWTGRTGGGSTGCGSAGCSGSVDDGEATTIAGGRSSRNSCQNTTPPTVRRRNMATPAINMPISMPQIMDDSP
jgi:hypothetical protein